MRSVTTLGGDVRTPAVVCRPSRCRGGCGRPSPSSGSASSPPSSLARSGPACRRCSCCCWSRCSCRWRSNPVSIDWRVRGWRRGTATAVILVGVFLGFLVFVVAIGTLVGQQIAELLGNSEKYVNRTVNFINDKFDTQHQRHAGDRLDQRPERCRCSGSFAANRARWSTCRSTALGVLVKGLSVMLFTFYLVADGPKLRRAICSRLRPDRQRARAQRMGVGDRQDRRLPVLAGAARRVVGASSTGSCSRPSVSRRRSRWRCGSA